MVVDIMLIPNVSEKPHLALRCEHRHTQSMDWSIAKAFIVKSASLVKPVEIFFVWFATPEVERTNFEVGKELAVVVFIAIRGIEEPSEICFRVDEMRMSCGKSSCSCPEGGEGACIVEDVHVEAILHIVITHESENIVINVAEIMNLMVLSSSPRARMECLHRVRLSNTNHNS